MKFIMLINLKLLTIANSFFLCIAEHENFSANKYKNDIFMFISRENFMLSWLEHEKSFYYLGARIYKILDRELSGDVLRPPHGTSTSYSVDKYILKYTSLENKEQNHKTEKKKKKKKKLDWNRICIWATWSMWLPLPQ